MSKPYSWEVYAWAKDPKQCGCPLPKAGDKIDLNSADWHRQETLVLIKYGFTLGSGHVSTKTKTGESTPWHWLEEGPKDALAIELWAQAADSNVVLVCALYEDTLNLGIYIGSGDGTCSGSTDVD